MSTNFKALSSADPMPSHVDSRTRIFGRTVGRSMFRSGLGSQDCNGSNMQLRSNNDFENIPDRRSQVPTFGHTMGLTNQLNQELGTMDHVNKSALPRTFGLQSRNPSLVSSLYQEDEMRLNPIIDHHRSNITKVSKTFGLLSEDINNERYNQDLRRNDNGSSFLKPKPFGLHTRTLALQSDGFFENSLRANQDAMNFRSTVSRTCLGPENSISQDNEGFNHNFRRNGSVNSSLMLRPFGLQTRNSNLNPEMGLRLNQDSTLRSSNISAISKTFVPAVRSATGFNMQESSRYNDDIIDKGGFRKPSLSRVIRGRSSILTSRLFQNQNTKRYCKDLSNINGFNVSHISLRDVDSQSDSRIAMNGRSDWLDNQSMSGSVVSAASMKCQFMNLLENLHHSILNIGPRVTAEAVRIEFDRAKQRLENISEMSFAPSVRENCGASVTSQSSKYICPSIAEPTTSSCIDGGSLNLKSTKDLLKSLISVKDNYRDKFNLSTHMEEEERGELSITSSTQNRKSNEESLFKKPRPYERKQRGLRILKTKSPKKVRNRKSASPSKMISLKQWYPVAVGSNLMLCGIDEEGAAVKTVAVKKRLNSRKVELINGLFCNLIGGPSEMVSVLPEKIMNGLKNGLADRWRVLQKELLNCQTIEATKKRVSKSPKVKSSPHKKKEKTPVKKKEKTPDKKGKTKKMSPEVKSTPKKKENEMRTRSGRTVKPPAMFWIVTGSDEVSSTIERSTPETTIIEEPSKKEETNISRLSPKKKSEKTTPKSLSKNNKKTVKASPKNKGKTSKEKLIKGCEGSPERKAKVSSGLNKKGNESFENTKLKDKSPKKKQRKENEEEDKVHSSTEKTSRETRGRKVQAKRKRDGTADGDSVQAKKSKTAKETEVESSVETREVFSKSRKKTNSGLTLSIRMENPKRKKSPAKKKKETVKNTETKSETKEINEFEEDFELKLDDIEIPEIANISGNTKLSRSQLRLISMETPPLKYFNTNLNLLRSATPVRSPSWCISQRTESEVKRFQKRREEAFKKKIKVDVTKTIITEKSKNVQNRDVKRVMEWVAEKTVRSPQWSSKVLQYVIPSRKQLEERMNDDDEEYEDVETEFL